MDWIRTLFARQELNEPTPEAERREQAETLARLEQQVALIRRKN
jgi:hypothetical protein